MRKARYWFWFSEKDEGVKRDGVLFDLRFNYNKIKNKNTTTSEKFKNSIRKS
jgi:hypothetical protein